MKKSLLKLIVLFIGLISLQSCDENIADTLEGTWEGNMYVSSVYDGMTYNATHTRICFLKDPFRYTSGGGYWVDYYSGAPWDYVANHIDWEVRNRTIYVHFIEENYNIRISNYRIDDDWFYGTLIDGDTPIRFELYHTTSPNWNQYKHWGWDDYNYYYSKSLNGKTPEKPRRTIRPITETN